MSDVIDKLRNDEDYYGKFGRQYLSNSDIKVLLENPSKYGVPTPDNPAFAGGRLFHQLILEPEKAARRSVCRCRKPQHQEVQGRLCRSRQVPFMLLCKEQENIKSLTDKMLGNLDFFDTIREDGNVYEQPAVGTIMGKQFKGKADILGTDCIIDLKTTSNLDDFKWSARKYGYDSQAYIYQSLFGKTMVFYAIDKKTGRMGMFDTSDDFIRRGRDKVERALEVYDRFFGTDATHNIETFYIKETL